MIKSKKMNNFLICGGYFICGMFGLHSIIGDSTTFGRLNDGIIGVIGLFIIITNSYLLNKKCKK